MKIYFQQVIVSTLLSFASSLAFCAPMGFKDSVMVMGDFSSNWKEAYTNYALTVHDAIGVQSLTMHSDNSLPTSNISRQATSLTYTRLAKRWNTPESQANLWLLGGVGAVTSSDFTGAKTLLSPGVQFDYETTRVYFSATKQFYRAADLNNDAESTRAGFSFYAVGYDDVQPWFIVEARRMKALTDKTEITPMLRLIQNRYFIELGVSTQKQARFNFMYTF